MTGTLEKNSEHPLAKKVIYYIFFIYYNQNFDS